ILPPNGDKRDYLSWAPYHWPNCNWCSGPREHLATAWTTCKYVVKDGHINPDVREIPGVSNAADVAQSILYNAAAAVLSGSEDFSKTAAQFIQAYFLDARDGMHPRVAYGQVIRGPGTQQGQYLGLIDLRGMVKVVNAVQIMREANAPAWTSALDTQMVNWASQYVKWMQSDPLGQKALSAPNNHGSFATNQLAAVNILVQDTGAATAALNTYFSNQFQDQIAASGEQPFEAVRTRPFHYRCFNLEAMITNAKLGDQLGLNFWSAKSKYGATIKDALDFVMAKGPGNEDIADIFPHIAAVAAAYGDPNGKYASYLRQRDERYQVSPYYFYDQPGALVKAPTSTKDKEEQTIAEAEGKLGELVESLKPTPTDLPVATPTIPWECPAAFAKATQVELDDGVYVTCDELKHLYGYTDEAKSDVES
ncbi:chondroitin AC/alginate lyase, partial [Fomitiporia mediterranea MF3/22]|uniref:chondroitin AC/alginate lyase n=1 Tax=Fomitiporia mediterranea (strain MF3/22) TaxID=694068 RepID=UPI0004407E37